MRSLRIGVTGGIGSGKSHICRIIERRGFPVFDTDRAAQREMTDNEELRERLRALVSPDVFLASGGLNKPVIRCFLHSSPENAARFDSEVHPFVRLAWRKWAQSRSESLVFMECALLYEAAFDTEVDRVIAVNAPEDLRIERVVRRDRIRAEQVKRWIAMQMDEEEKIRRADYVISNSDSDDPEKNTLEVLEKLIKETEENNAELR